MYKLVTSIEARIVFFGSFVFSMKFIRSFESFEAELLLIGRAGRYPATYKLLRARQQCKKI